MVIRSNRPGLPNYLHDIILHSSTERICNNNNVRILIKYQIKIIQKDDIIEITDGKICTILKFDQCFNLRVGGFGDWLYSGDVTVAEYELWEIEG